jgi:hypothetical protein
VASGDVRVGSELASRKASPRSQQRSKAPLGGQARSEGDMSPAIISGGDVSVRPETRPDGAGPVGR